jgi:hypothetical protein
LTGVDDGWEWEPSLIGFRHLCESEVLASLLRMVGSPSPTPDVVAGLRGVVASESGPSLSGHLSTVGTVEQFREFAVHRSAYQLKEADPHTWALPRLTGEAKAALALIQHDEYGSGVAGLMHATLFAKTLSALGLNPSYGAYLDVIPGVTLTTVNLISLFGLHRRWRGALIGHLAVFEMCSVGPNAAYANGLRRLGFGSDASAFYQAHVLADAIHQEIAVEMASALARCEPAVAGDIIFGARSIMATESQFSRRLLDSWAAGQTSLRRPLG